MEEGNDNKVFIGELDTIVIEGGGIKGTASLGSLAYLQDNDRLKKVNTFVGTSIGAIICLLLVIGYTTDEIKSILFDQDLKSLTQDNLFFAPYRLYRTCGLHSGARIVRLLEECLEKKYFSKDITLAQLNLKTRKVLITTGVSLTDTKTYYFNFKTFPHMKVVDAVRISFSIPLYFSPIKYSIDGIEHCFVDGAVLCNYPLYYNDYVKKYKKYYKTIEEYYENYKLKNIEVARQFDFSTLGILTVSGKDVFPRYEQINSVVDVIKRIINTFVKNIENNNNNINSKYFKTEYDIYKERSIKIVLDDTISATSFDLTKDELENMYNIGYKSAERFINM